ncbi:galactonate dehydratase [Candidatus Poribacteria bacterium]|mgnify:CR=1 FL=1|jgi:galactonate dehydratase|nr:galactonate dehydratase [Candidatus Poribacteria bacterium]MBT5533360.1 galactonate dehydratase [Candidatus Poribacteria bacterium]MBT5715106.1 galactonate dehydratase [Candidatus Poribacteria bacterium]MBT7099823.1 galactonate dehydratase [Candidatus Poribacteria bacterium]MBT7809508.1 galactonate dehydratase [Candidatus Poribacteria bacterium]
MKITRVSSVVVNAEMRNWVFVKVETDQDGLWGWGEASLEWKTRAVVGAIDDFAPMLVGEDPTRIEHLYQKMYRQSFWRMGVIGMSAISGIEQALWDILGKHKDSPVCELLGGRVRDKVRMYTHLGGGQMSAVYETQMQAGASQFVDLAREVVEQGYTAVKVLLTPPTEPLNSAADCRYAEGVMRALRDGLGEDIDIMVDCHGRHFPANAIEFCRVLAPYRPYFVEEPVPPENVEAMAEVRRASPVPIATGERLVTRFGFREVLEKQACHIIQPDLCHCGGLWEAKKIAAMAEAYYVGVAPHNPLGPVANAAALHFALSTPNFLIQEDMLSDVPWRWDVVKHDLRTEDGHWLPTNAPGLGIEVDEDEARKHPFKQEVMHSLTVRAADGAILDW